MSGTRPGSGPTSRGTRPGARPGADRSTGPAAAPRRPSRPPPRRSVASSHASARPRTSLTGRAAVLALAVGMLVLSLAYPVRQYVAQRAEISALRAEAVAAEGRVAGLQEQQRRWADPAYVRAQARERLNYVLPGEIGYIVVDDAQGEGDRPTVGTSATVPTAEQPWFTRLWTSVEEASRPAVPAVPPPSLAPLPSQGAG